MKHRISHFLLIVFISLLILLPSVPRAVQAQAGTATDLVAAVNQLRTSNGLKTLEADAILMSIAQQQSDYQASLGYWTHEGPGGTTPKQRAAAAGYGGGVTIFISENVAALSTSASFETLLYTIWADELNWNTLTNSSYLHVGAGIAVSGDEVYYTLVVGYLSGGLTAYTPAATFTPIGTSSAPTEIPTDAMIPVVTSTPHIDGSIIHHAEQGQTMWEIAIAYGMTISEIVQLNNMDPNDPVLWPGDDLLIRPSLEPSATVLASATQPAPTSTPRPTNTPRPPTRTPAAELSPTPTENSLLPDLTSPEVLNRRNLGIGVIIFCGLGLIVVILAGMFSRN